MIDHPRLTYTADDEPAIAVTLDPPDTHSFAEPSRKTFLLSTRAVGLVLDELDYADREEIAPVTVSTLFLTGGAYLPDEKTDPAEIIERFRSPDGGKHPTDREIDHVAEHLQSSEIDQRLRWLAEDLVAGSRLSELMDPDDIETGRERMTGLREIAKEL